MYCTFLFSIYYLFLLDFHIKVDDDEIGQDQVPWRSIILATVNRIPTTAMTNRRYTIALKSGMTCATEKGKNNNNNKIIVVKTR